MNEATIQEMQIKDMLSTEVICSIQAEPEEVREQLKALCFARLEELNATKDLKNQFKKVFKAYENADRELAKAYTKQNAKNNRPKRLCRRYCSQVSYSCKKIACKKAPFRVPSIIP